MEFLHKRVSQFVGTYFDMYVPTYKVKLFAFLRLNQENKLSKIYFDGPYILGSQSI